MKRDDVFRNSELGGNEFEFNAEVAEVFDDMLVRSIPLYEEQQYMIRRIARKHWIPGTVVYDLGCSTGTTLLGMAQELQECSQFIGYDNSVPMLEEARRKIAERQTQDRIQLLYRDLSLPADDLILDNASVVIVAWTLQFLRPLRRADLIQSIYRQLVENGVLIVTEKILGGHSESNRCFVEHYYDFKRANGYSETEIARKREALENVLIPYRVEENLELFRKNGFEIAEMFFQWFNFAGFLCVKKPG